jgi:hypothetical protein
MHAVVLTYMLKGGYFVGDIFQASVILTLKELLRKPI